MRMKEKLAELLTNIFTTSGHNVTESDTVDLIVEKNDHKTLILLANKPDPAQIRNFADQTHGGTGLYVTMEKMEPELHDYATHVGLITWDRDELALQIGKAVIADLEGNAADLHLVAYDIDSTAIPVEDSTISTPGSGSFEVANDINTTVLLQQNLQYNLLRRQLDRKIRVSTYGELPLRCNRQLQQEVISRKRGPLWNRL